MTQRPALPTLIEQADAAGVALFATTVALPSDGSAPEWVTVFPKTGRVVEAVRDDAPAAGPSLPTAGASRSRQPVRGPSMDGHFSGYASLFHVPDLGRDTVAPGAFCHVLVQMAQRREAGKSGISWE